MKIEEYVTCNDYVESKEGRQLIKQNLLRIGYGLP